MEILSPLLTSACTGYSVGSVNLLAVKHPHTIYLYALYIDSMCPRMQSEHIGICVSTNQNAFPIWFKSLCPSVCFCSFSLSTFTLQSISYFTWNNPASSGSQGKVLLSHKINTLWCFLKEGNSQIERIYEQMTRKHMWSWCPYFPFSIPFSIFWPRLFVRVCFRFAYTYINIDSV